jgi:hypothetical protein
MQPTAITLMQGIYNYIPETKDVSSVYMYIHNVTAILQLQFMVLVMLLLMLNVVYFYISNF